MPQTGTDLGETTHSKHLAEVGRSRSGLFGLYRPRKTVSPVTQQGSHDLTFPTKCGTMSHNSTADDGQEACPEPDSDSAWSTLPEHLIETIMQMLQEDSPPAVHHNNRAAMQVHQSLAISHCLCCFLKQKECPSQTITANEFFGPQTQFAATSVSRSWRKVGRRAFFRSLWDQSGAIKHPVQLFGLVYILKLAQINKQHVMPYAAKSLSFPIESAHAMLV